MDAVLRYKQTELLKADQDKNRVEEIGDEIISLQNERQSIMMEAALQKGVEDRINEFSDFLNSPTMMITEYSDTLVRRLIEKITVYDEKLTVEFKSGLEIEVEI